MKASGFSDGNWESRIEALVRSDKCSIPNSQFLPEGAHTSVAVFPHSIPSQCGLSLSYEQPSLQC
jgi:hypothetical protein